MIRITKYLFPSVYLVFFFCTPSSATTYEWNGERSTFFDDPDNWTPSGVPGTSDNIIISEDYVGTGDEPYLVDNVTVTSFTISGGVLNLDGYLLDITGNVSASGGRISYGIINFTGSSVIFSGTEFDCDVVANCATVLFNGSVFGSTVDITKTGSSTDNCSGGNDFVSSTSITNTGTGPLILAVTTGDTYWGDVNFTNTNIGGLYPYTSSGGANSFNGNIVVNCTGNGGIWFGSKLYGGSSGTATLANTKTITVGSSGFTTGSLFINQFTQTGATAQSFTVTGNTSLNILSSTFNGNLTVKALATYLYDNIFNGTAAFTKDGGIVVNGWGGNTFNQALTVVMTSSVTSGGIYTSTTSTGDVYNGNATFVNKSVSADIHIGKKGTSAFNGNIIVTNTSNGGIQFGVGTATVTLANTKTITTNTFSAGVLNLRNFTQLGTTAQSFTLTGTTSYVYLGSNSTFNGNVNITAPSIYLLGATYNGTTVFKNTFGSAVSNGGNTFNNTLTINATAGAMYLSGSGSSADTYSTTVTINASGGSVYLAHLTSGNTFNGNVVVNNTGSGAIYWGYNGGTSTLAGGKTITVGGSGFSGGQLGIAGLTQVGATPQSLTLTGTAKLILGDSPFAFNRTTFNGNVTFTAPVVYMNGCTYNGTATIEETVSEGGGTWCNGGAIYNNTTTITVSGATGFSYMATTFGDTYNSNVTFNLTGSDAQMYWGGLGGTHTYEGTVTYNNYAAPGFFIGMMGGGEIFTYNGDVTVNNYCSNVVGGYIYFGYDVTFNGNIILNQTSSNSNYIYFGADLGSPIVTLADSYSITVGASGFSSGILHFSDFVQAGSTMQSFTLTGTATIELQPGTTFNGPLAVKSPQVYLNGSTFVDVIDIEKTGATDNISTGGNLFGNIATIQNSSSAAMTLANSAGDDFNSRAFFIQTGAGALQPAYNTTNTFASRISTTGSSSVITFGAGANGRVKFDGDGSQEQIIRGDIAFPPVFTRLQAATSNSATITLDVPVTISADLTLTSGNILTSYTNLLTLNDNVTCSPGKSTSFVDGPLEKKGNDAFVFPIGDGSKWARLGISAPSAATANTSFTAEYFAQQYTVSIVPVTAPLTDVSSVEHWILTRTVTVSTCSVTLYWESDAFSHIDGTPGTDLVVARFNESTQTWEDKGQGALTDAGTTGNLRSNAVSSFSPFTFGSKSFAVNPLPIQLLEFTAKANEHKQVDLTWTTTAEINNDYFTIEKAKDSKEFEYVSTTDGAGNSTQSITYNSVDAHPYPGISYYRLKQTDYDGKCTYSHWKSVNIEENTSEFEISVYPNPTKNNELNLFFNGKPGQEILITLYDALGKNYYSKTIVIEDNKQLVLKIADGLHFSPGIYNIAAFSDNILLNKKVVVE